MAYSQHTHVHVHVHVPLSAVVLIGLYFMYGMIRFSWQLLLSVFQIFTLLNHAVLYVREGGSLKGHPHKGWFKVGSQH